LSPTLFAQTFLSGEFRARTASGATYTCHRCFACYPTQAAKVERSSAVRIAKVRLNAIYQEFHQSGIAYTHQFFI
jgi:NifB/MoaA-like Fe-S oxidoreductase